MVDSKSPVPAVAPIGLAPVFEPGDSGSVDDAADFQHGVLVRCGEIEVGGESPVVSEAALAQARAAFERKLAVVERSSSGE